MERINRKMAEDISVLIGNLAILNGDITKYGQTEYGIVTNALPKKDTMFITGGRGQMIEVKSLPAFNNESNWSRGVSKKSKDDVHYIFKNGSEKGPPPILQLPIAITYLGSGISS